MAEAEYGSWLSPLTADLITTGSLRLSQPYFDGDDVYWIEGRAAEGGRSVICCRTADGQTVDVTPAPFNVRSAVHEYGGGAYIVVDGTIYFSNFADHRIYCHKRGEEPKPLVPAGPYRYADFALDAKRNRLILVVEDHSEPGEEPLSSLNWVSLDGSGAGETLLAGYDFFSTPRVSPDGKLLAWLTWSHPHMPWEETKLWTANLGNDGSLTNVQQVAGGKGESIFQPEWGPDGTLYFISDKNGWGNPHACYSGLVEPLLEQEGLEFGYPQWVFALSTFDVIAANRLLCAYTRGGVWSLAELDCDSRKLTEIELPYKDLGNIRVGNGKAVMRAGAPGECGQIVSLDLKSILEAGGKAKPEHITVLRKANNLTIDPGYISQAQSIEFDTAGGGKAYAFYYPPANKDYTAPAGSAPPLMVKSHGGPTGACTSSLDLGVQFWTSRGFAVVDVNYGGSTGFGKPYRERLNGQWGVVDVDDCENAALHLVKAGKADPNRLLIAGGSAGGYTTLCALAFRKTFKCGASYFGVSDLEGLAKDTHKFESRYLDSLVGKYPQEQKLYQERSPVNSPDKLSCPIVFFQGLEDKVVPPSQSRAMVEALRKKKIPCAYLEFEGEQHGFRKSETIKTCLNAELYFYCKIFGIKRTDQDDVELEISDLRSAVSA